MVILNQISLVEVAFVPTYFRLSNNFKICGAGFYLILWRRQKSFCEEEMQYLAEKCENDPFVAFFLGGPIESSR